MNAMEIIICIMAACSVFLLKPCLRKGSPNPAKTCQARLNRIKTASIIFQWFICLTFALGFYWVLAFLCGWPFFSQGGARIVITHSHLYTSPAAMPSAIFGLWLVQTGLGFASAAVMFALFRLYGRGVLFSAKNIICIRFQGYALIIGSMIDYQMQSTLHDMAWSTTPVFAGLLIIFIAWIMDEGRKIQEEQELTV